MTRPPMDANSPISSLRPSVSHVTSLDAPVFGITGLPEEVVAVVLAYVSRSPRGFRENLDRLLTAGNVEPGGDLAFGAAQETAKRFHEQWVVGYGHASVAEHAVVHLGVEGISRLASAELELANRYISFTEYSQRYQRPRRDGSVIPPEVLQLVPAQRDQFTSTLEACYNAYEALLEDLTTYHMRTAQIQNEEKPEARRKRLSKAAFEDARYALPLAWKTALGMTANARALQEAIVWLLESPYAECRQLAKDVKREAERLLPTLLRHAESARPPLSAAALVRPNRTITDEVTLVDFVGRGFADPEVEAARALAWVSGNASGPAVMEDIARRMAQAGEYAAAPHELGRLRYSFILCLSEASWHQLLRHRREADFYPDVPSWDQTIVVPPNIERAGARKLLEAAAERASEAAAQLAEASPVLASYLTLGAHRRVVRLDIDLAELTHLVRLRLRSNAQWDVRSTVRRMAAEVCRVHPFAKSLWGEEVLTWQSDERPPAST